MTTFIVLYKGLEGEVKLAQLEAENYGKAQDKAEQIIQFINQTFKYDTKSLVKVQKLVSVENWSQTE